MLSDPQRFDPPRRVEPLWDCLIKNFRKEKTAPKIEAAFCGGRFPKTFLPYRWRRCSLA